MAADKLNRRDFVRQGTVATAGRAFSLTATKMVFAGNRTNEDTSVIPSYNPEMEYRRCGKMEMMMSAVWLGEFAERISVVEGVGVRVAL